MAHGIQITFDAADPPALASFWALALGYIEQPPPPGFDTWEAFALANDLPADEIDKYGAVIDPDGQGPRVLFQKVPEGKVAKNRMHMDVHVSGDATPETREAHIAELVAAGAVRGDEFTELGVDWVTMSDPEGNEFCVS